LNGEYIALSSSNYTADFLPFNCFSSNNTAIWQSADRYSSSTNLGIYVGTVTTTIITTTTISVSGEWVQIKLPYTLSLSGYTFLPRNGSLPQYPKQWYLVGSNDGITWYAIDYRTGITVSSTTYFSYGNSYENTNYYTYFRVITISTNNDRPSTNNVVALDQIQLQGTGR
jgi:hypothetical protein